MPEKLSTARYLLHRVCARPFVICWILGTLAFWIPVTVCFLHGGVFDLVATDWSILLMMLFGYAGTSGLGFFAGVFFGAWLILPLCRRLNGAPHEVGECVMILSGPRTGTEGHVCGISKGQGGQLLPHVKLGEEAGDKYRGMFEEYELLRRSKRKTLLVRPSGVEEF